VDALDIYATRRRLEESGGGYEIAYTSSGLGIGVYVLVAPEPGRQQPHADDEVYVVLEGRGVLTIGGSRWR
jgi:mannose-6-phosphate isomerase-like protein (cupin superfamily)